MSTKLLGFPSVKDVCCAIIVPQKKNTSKKSLKVQYCHDTDVNDETSDFNCTIIVSLSDVLYSIDQQ